MNTALKHWKEAATLILAAGHRLGPDSLLLRTPLAASASSPQVSSDGRSHLPDRSRFDYDVLLLKRSGKSGFMPNAYVFPGGLLDSSDFSSDWLDIFKSFTEFPNFGLKSVRQPVETRPPIFATDRLKFGSPVPGEVALRICALRETFEECGVLLAVSKMAEKSVLKSSEDAFATQQHNVNDLDSSELSKWRDLVNQNPSNFIRMCRELELVPNIWALYEWSNWLTPVGRYGTKRFDTAFFICCLQDIPHTLQDENEIVRFQLKMLVKVERGGKKKYVKLEEACFSDFISAVQKKFLIPESTALKVTDDQGIEVDEDVFPEVATVKDMCFVIYTDEEFGDGSNLTQYVTLTTCDLSVLQQGDKEASSPSLTDTLSNSSSLSSASDTGCEVIQTLLDSTRARNVIL